MSPIDAVFLNQTIKFPFLPLDHVISLIVLSLLLISFSVNIIQTNSEFSNEVICFLNKHLY